MHIKDSFPELYRIRRKPLQLEEARERLRGKHGRDYWQSLEELAGSDEFEEMLHREFPQQAGEWGEGTDRRTFLKLMGASLALAGLSGCVYQPPETVVPYVKPPEGTIPGKPLFFATAMPLGGAATGLLVRSNEGRPTKVEGNPDHPGSLGATDIFSQASILTLYDPDRSQTVNNRGELRTYTAFLGEMSTALEGQRSKGGAGLRFLTETVISPTMYAQVQDILRRFPAAKWYQYEPAGNNFARVGAKLAFGDYAHPVYHFEQAERVLSLDCDFLLAGPSSLRYARDFATRRRPSAGAEMNRLYVVESTPTNTGMFADHRLSIRPSRMEAIARAIASGVGAQGGANTGAALTPEQVTWVNAVVADLKEHAGRSIVVVGDEQSPAIHALAHAMNAALTNAGKTVTYTDPVEFKPTDQMEDLRALVSEIDAGTVEMLVIVGGNPVYATPSDLKLDKDRLSKVPLRVHLSMYEDETSELCHWHIPEAHFLETWSDTRAFDGTATIMQPLIAPLYNGKSAHEFLAAFTDRPDRTGYDIVREFWATRLGANAQPLSGIQAAGTQQNTSGAQNIPQTALAPRPAAMPATTAPPSADFEKFWRKAVHDGVVPNTQVKERTLSVRGDFAAGDAVVSAPTTAGTSGASGAGGGQYEIVFRADPHIYDGRFANNGWLQELPKPLTKLTWDNVAIISPATAEKLNVGTQPDGAAYSEGRPVRVNNLTAKGGEMRAEVLKLTFRGRTVLAPVFILAGQPDEVVTVHLGYGRWRSGAVGGNKHDDSVRGFNAYDIRTSDALWSAAGLDVATTGEQYPLACTQIHFRMEGREIVRAGTFEDFRKNPGLEHEREHEDPPKPAGENRPPKETESLYPGYDYNEGERSSRGYKWGMAIDLSTCVGCNACVVACQSENNIPVVGKEQVARSREMHWLRVDAYFRGAVDNPDGVYFMPVPCMHCENAPCEPVCPVHATVHSAEGTNDMIYNRCVGTRYCSNNCPYKVRRFNFLLYQDWNTPSYKLMRNPEVTIRSRGVMEKCTYCIQRIESAKIEAEKESRKVRDGEIVTACQAVCPTEAIIFGDLNDPDSRVAKSQSEPRTYGLLDDLNTRPRTRHLAAVRNPNPALGGKA
ncbi:MAG: TAT-variant-translocated molybdopterin oxidoreductase [Acidobacteria bacterium]|nr:TAT-variant-translocated molybdopterin oxidoreductase [Acidobacteriota bacterium]